MYMYVRMYACTNHRNAFVITAFGYLELRDDNN
jgi:hypothetical protein